MPRRLSEEPLKVECAQACILLADARDFLPLLARRACKPEMKMKAKHNSLKIQVALFPESVKGAKMWIARCFEFDLVAQGATIEEAKESFHRILIGHVCLSLKNRENPFPCNFPMLSRRAARSRPGRSPRQFLRSLKISYGRFEQETEVPAL